MRRITKNLVVFLLIACAGLTAFASGQGEKKADTLTFYWPGNTPRELDAVLSQVDGRIKDSINAKIVFNFIPWGDYFNKIRALQAAGDSYECNFDGDWGGIPTLLPQGAYLGVDKLVPKYAPTIWKRVPKEVWDGCKYNGEIVAVPWLWPKSEKRFIHIRQDLYKKYGLKEFDTLKGDIFTLDDYEKFLEKVKQNEPTMFGLAPDYAWITWFAYIDGYCFLSPQWNIVYKRNDPEMKLIDLEKTDFYKQMLIRMHRWYVNGYFEKDVLAEKEDYKTLMIVGKAASIVHVFDGWNEINMQVKPAHPDWEIKTYVLSGDKVGPLAHPMNNSLMFNRRGKNPEKAMAFWEWVHKSQDNYDLLLYGIKGKHWVETADGKVSIPKPYSMSDSPYYGWHGRWAAWWPELERSTVDDLPNWKELTIKHVYNDKMLPHIGFYPDLAPIKNELAARFSLKQNQGLALEFGVTDPKTGYDDYIAAQKAAGVDKVIEELQKQLDAWRTSKK